MWQKCVTRTLGGNMCRHLLTCLWTWNLWNSCCIYDNLWSFLIQSKIWNPSRPGPPRSNKRMRTHVVEANDFGHFFSPGVEDPVSNTDCLPAILCIENLSRAGRVRKNSKCWQCRQPRLNHTYQSHVESYTYTVLLCQLCLTIWSLSPLRNYERIQLCSWMELVHVQLRGMAQCSTNVLDISVSLQ